MSSIIRRIAAVAAIIATISALMLIPSPPAVAASGDKGKVSSTATLHSCSDPRCPVTSTAAASTLVQVWCWRDGGSFNGTVRWFRITFGGQHTWISASQLSAQPSVPYCNNLEPGEALYPGESVWSSNRAYELIMQGDGNVVAYGPSGALWASSTSGTSNTVIMQSDGNLVVYGSSGALWASGTGFPGTQLVVQDDSNLVMYGSPGAVWASNWHRSLGGQWRSANWGAAGNCTWYAMDRWNSFWSAHHYPAFTGNAVAWPSSARATGWQVMSLPATQAMVVMPSTDPDGHVAWVDSMRPESDGTYIHIWEMNHIGLGIVDDRWVKVISGMSFIPAPAI